MQLAKYYAENHNKVSFTREQASAFAKQVAGDFNPIHDIDAKRFCVPGDLLFALVLNKYGLSQHMHFSFSGMVTEGVLLNFPELSQGTLHITDQNNKEYMSIECNGEVSTDQALITELTRRYVEFSGQTFPHILIPLMEEKHVMINPERPLIIYESMVIDMNRLDISAPTLELSNARLTVDGKRGDVCLEFCLKNADEVVGKGMKNMVLSGLRDYDQSIIEGMVNNYNARKLAYLN